MGVRREEEVILWATAFRMTGLSWEISVKRARELFSCFPLFRDISCGILLFSVTELCLLGFSCQQDLQAVPERLTVYLVSNFVIYLKGTLTLSFQLQKWKICLKFKCFLGDYSTRATEVVYAAVSCTAAPKFQSIGPLKYAWTTLKENNCHIINNDPVKAH